MLYEVLFTAVTVPSAVRPPAPEAQLLAVAVPATVRGLRLNPSAAWRRR